MTMPGQNLVLITRPATDAEDFARDIRGLGLIPLIEPMLGIIPVPFEIPDFAQFSAIIFTSANAVRVFGRPEAATDIPVFAVGMHTAEEAKKRGYNKVLSADGAAGDLAALIKKKLAPSAYRLLHIRGEHTAMPLGEMLRKDRITVDSLVIYTAKSEDSFTPVCQEALEKGTIGAVTFFSKRTAQNFIHLVRQKGLETNLSGIKALCISPAVLECVREAAWKDAYSAARPDRAAMLDLLKTSLTD